MKNIFVQCDNNHKCLLSIKSSY